MKKIFMIMAVILCNAVSCNKTSDESGGYKIAVLEIMLDRDTNAAINIKRMGLTQLGIPA